MVTMVRVWLPAGVTSATGMPGRVPSVKTELEKVFRAAIMQAFPGTEDDPVVAPTKEAKFGDYQCNNAMRLFNQLKGKVSSCPSHLHVPT